MQNSTKTYTLLLRKIVADRHADGQTNGNETIKATAEYACAFECVRFCVCVCGE